MRQSIAWIVTGCACLVSLACQGMSGAAIDAKAVSFLSEPTHSLDEKFVLHKEPLSREAIADYLRRMTQSRLGGDDPGSFETVSQEILKTSTELGMDPYILTAIVRHAWEVGQAEHWRESVRRCAILKDYLTAQRSQKPNESLYVWYRDGLKLFRGGGDAEAFQELVLSWADALENEYGGVASVAVKVQNDAGLIVDQAARDIFFTGVWTEVKSELAENGSYRHDQNRSKGTKSVAFKIHADTGVYRVYARWVNHEDDAGTNVPVEIRHLHGQTVVTVNQKANPGEWKDIGTYSLDSATSLLTVANRGTDGFVSADAFKLIPVASDSLIIIDSHERNVGRVVLKGAWKTNAGRETAAMAYQKAVHEADPRMGIATATYTPNASGRYKVTLRALKDESLASNVRVIVHAVGLRRAFAVDQKVEGDEVELGVFELNPSSSVTVSTEGADGPVVVDALRLDAAP